MVVLAVVVVVVVVVLVVYKTTPSLTSCIMGWSSDGCKDGSSAPTNSIQSDTVVVVGATRKDSEPCVVTSTTVTVINLSSSSSSCLSLLVLVEVDMMMGFGNIYIREYYILPLSHKKVDKLAKMMSRLMRIDGTGVR